MLRIVPLPGAGATGSIIKCRWGMILMRIVVLNLFTTFYQAKELQFNARVSKPDPAFATLLLEQFGGANGELAAALRYSHRHSGQKTLTLINTIFYWI